jgi:hypothetical protein
VSIYVPQCDSSISRGFRYWWLQGIRPWSLCHWWGNSPTALCNRRPEHRTVPLGMVAAVHPAQSLRGSHGYSAWEHTHQERPNCGFRWLFDFSVRPFLSSSIIKSNELQCKASERRICYWPGLPCASLCERRLGRVANSLLGRCRMAYSGELESCPGPTCSP